VGERRGRETSDLDLSLPTSSEPHIEVTPHEDTRAGRAGGCAAHWKPPAMAPTPMAMDVAGKEGREASDLDPSPPTSSEPHRHPHLQIMEVTVREDERVGREGRCAGSLKAARHRSYSGGHGCRRTGR